MTSHRTKYSKMQVSCKEKKMLCGKIKSNAMGNDKPKLPLAKKSVYMDVKQGKQAKTIEEQLKLLGASVEKFLSREVNYVISSFAPARHDERPSTGEDNPQSPSFVPSPFSCGPSPTASSDNIKKSVVSRGKTIAQIACARKQTTNTVISSAEKLGIKVVSAEVASKWLEKELKKIEKECFKDKKENSQDRQKKGAKRKRKLLKGAYIKFEACNRMYRPIRSELDHWPKVNPLAPPGLNPFTEVKIKAPLAVNVRRQLLLRNKKTSCKGILPGKPRMKKSCSTSVIQETRIIKSPPGVPDLIGVPITTTGDVKKNMENHWKKRQDKMQGYCECCEIRYKNLSQHLNEDCHQSFARNKSNYESLDRLITEIPSPVDFLTTLVLQHCSQKQSGTQPKHPDKQLRDVLPALSLDVVSPLSSLKTCNDDLGLQNMCTPELDQDASTDIRLLSDEREKTNENKTEGKSDKRLQAVVIRRPLPSGIFTSPRRRQLTPSKKPWVQERCMVFRDSPLASLQPSCLFSKITSINVSEKRSVSPCADSSDRIVQTKQNEYPKNCISVNTGIHDCKTKEDPVFCSGLDMSKKVEKEEQEEMPTRLDVPSQSSNIDPVQEKIARSFENDLACLEEVKAVPCIADRVKTRTRKNTTGEKLDDKVHQSVAMAETFNNKCHSKNWAHPHEVNNLSSSTLFDTIFSGKSRREELLEEQNTNDVNSSKIIRNDGANELIQLNTLDHFAMTKRKADTEHSIDDSSVMSNDKKESVQVKSTCSIQCSKVVLGESQVVHVFDNCHTPKKNELSISACRNYNSIKEPSSDNSKFIHTKKSKDVNRALFVDSPSRRFPSRESSQIQTPVKKYHENTCSRLHDVAENFPLPEDQANVLDRVMRGNASENVEESCGGKTVFRNRNGRESNVRQCRLLMPDGMYANDGEGSCPKQYNEDVNTIRKESHQKIRETSSPKYSQVCESKEKTKTGIKNMKNGLKKNSKLKSYDRKKHNSIDWNRNGSTAVSENCAGNNNLSPNNKVVPNIAERVKKRRSCTYFNHEGQYANDGEGNEPVTPKSTKIGNNKRKIFKARKRLVHAIRKHKSLMSDSSQSTISSEAGEREDVKGWKQSNQILGSKSKNTSPAVVIRRYKPSFKPLSKSEANWCTNLSDKDWSQCETEEEGCVSSHDVKMENQSDKPIQGQAVAVSSVTSDNDQANSGEVKEMETTPKPQRVRSQTGTKQCVGKDEKPKTCLTPLFNKCHRLHHLNGPHHSSPRNRTGSPRLRLIIQRDSVNECYSSTLEEIYDEECDMPHLSCECEHQQPDSAFPHHNNQMPVLKNPEETDLDCHNIHTPIKEEEKVLQYNTTANIKHEDDEQLQLEQLHSHQSSSVPPCQNQFNLNDQQEKCEYKMKNEVSLETSKECRDCKSRDRSVKKRNKLKALGSSQRSEGKNKHIVNKRKQESGSLCLNGSKKYETTGDILDPTQGEKTQCGQICESYDTRTKKDQLIPQDSNSVRDEASDQAPVTPLPQCGKESYDHMGHTSFNDGKKFSVAEPHTCKETLKEIFQFSRKGMDIEPSRSIDRTKNKRTNSGADRLPNHHAVIHSTSQMASSEVIEGKINQTSVSSCPLLLATTESVEDATVEASPLKNDAFSKDEEEDLNKNNHLRKMDTQSKKNRVKRHRSRQKKRAGNSIEESLPVMKKRKISYSLLDESFEQFEDNESSQVSGEKKYSLQKTASSIMTESDSSEIDFPKLNQQNISQNVDCSFANSPNKKFQGVNEDKSVEICEENQSGLMNKNPPVNSNLGDLLNFVPTFSSPGKTNSSWDDACDSYLNTSVQPDVSTTPFSPSPGFASPSHTGLSSVRSPTKRTPKKNQKYFSSDILTQFSSPTKKSTNTSVLEKSPAIQKVDSDISFNHMSPQRLHFSPIKCEKSYKRNFNSPSKDI